MRRLAALLALMVSCAPASPQEAAPSSATEHPAAAAVATVEELLDRVAHAAPGLAVVVVSPDEVLLRKVVGRRNAATDAPLLPDTPLYIASQTKAYVGLLAARLDADGVLGLDDRIADHWPEIRLPAGADPSEWRLRDLLTHQFPLQVGFIATLEAYVTELAAADYPGLMAQYGRARAPGFRYANTGYNIWAAILETATGRSWRVWLHERVFGPLGMTRTSTRTSDFGLDALSWNHLWAGPDIGWHAVRPKTDAMMQSAGGIVTSTDDMGRWLQAHLGGPPAVDAGIARATIAATHAVGADLDPDEPNSYGLPCDGYGLGWNRCDVGGEHVYVHGGGYTGARTTMAFSPGLGVGIGVFSNSDNMTGWLTARIVETFFRAIVSPERAPALAAAVVGDYPPRTASYLRSRQEQVRDTRAESRWGGWEWTPSVEELREYVGRYDSGDPYRVLEVELEGRSLRARVGDLSATMEPARRDLFGTSTHPFRGPLPLRFERDAGGAIVGASWSEPRVGNARFRRPPTEG